MGNSSHRQKPVTTIVTCQIPHKPKIMFYGDSLTEGYHLDPKYRYTTLFQKYIDEYKLNWEVINAGKSGDTVLGTMPRFQFEIITHNPRIVCICLGGNDLFQGGWDKMDIIKSELVNMINYVKQNGMTPILICMAPPFSSAILNAIKLIPEAEKRISFFSMYEEIANENKLLYIDSIFQDFPFKSDMVILTNMSKSNFFVKDMVEGDYFVDVVHPNDKGHAIIARYFFACIKSCLN